MAMIWDSVLVTALQRELEPLLNGERLRAHSFRWDDRALVLWFRSGTLRWSLHPNSGWLTFDPPEDPHPDARPLAAEVTRISAPPDERTLTIHLRRPRGLERSYRLTVELMTNQWNALLLEGPEARIRHLLWTRHLEDRELVVGRRYQPPSPSRRIGAQEPMTIEDWQGILKAEPEDGPRQSILDRVAYTSPINMPHILGSDPEGPAGEVAPEDALAQWRGLASPPSDGAFVLETRRGKQPYPIAIKGYKHTEMPNLLSAIAAVAKEDTRGSTDPETGVRADLERALNQARGRVRGIRREMEQAEDPEVPRAMANLLLARLGSIPRGAAAVTLTGFQGEEVEIPLDPSLPPQENADHLYQEAARRERARDRLPALLDDSVKEVERLEALRAALETGSASAESIRERLPEGSGKRRRKPGQRQEERLPYHSFVSSGGLEIRVGRGSRENDELTFRHSRPGDVWLHARDSAGAHVILRWADEGNPPRKDLGEAAILAALNSGARNAGTVPVDWTRRKYVRKPRKAPPGTVLPARVQTLFVEPDQDLPRRLRSRGPSPS